MTFLLWADHYHPHDDEENAEHDDGAHWVAALCSLSESSECVSHNDNSYLDFAV